MAISVLAKGSIVVSTETTVLTSSSQETNSISNFVLCNTSATAIDVVVRVIDGGSNKTKLTSVSIPGGDGVSRIVPEGIGGIGPNFSISLQPSTTNGVDYTIYGNASAS